MSSLYVAVCLLFLVVFSLGAEVSPGKVLSLNADSFNNNIPSEENTWVIMLYVILYYIKYSVKNLLYNSYAPWCGRCTNILPIWDEVADHYKEDDHLFLGKVDCTTNHALCGRQLIGKYPVFA